MPALQINALAEESNILPCGDKLRCLSGRRQERLDGETDGWESRSPQLSSSVQLNFDFLLQDAKTYKLTFECH
jgi:hypothetical protein